MAAFVTQFWSTWNGAKDGLEPVMDNAISLRCSNEADSYVSERYERAIGQRFACALRGIRVAVRSSLED
jgi:hypothetical protein